jgi:hypothetical protein
MRLTRQEASNDQHLTIPAHKPLRVGTLRQILKDVAAQTGRSMAAVVQSVAG